MTIRFKVAKTAKELDSLFQVRHQLLTDETGRYPKRPDMRLVDRFDAFPTTVNIIAVENLKVIGGMRLTESSEAGIPTDQFYNYTPYLPDDADKVAATSMFCLNPDYLDIQRIAFIIMCMGAYWALSRGINVILAAVYPKIEPIAQSIGFERMAQEFFDPEQNTPIIPMILHISKLHDPFLSFVKRMGINHYIENFEREFYKAGDKIIRYGEQGDSAYVIVYGKVAVTIDQVKEGAAIEIILQELGQGEVFGELALLNSRPRTANVVAETDVDVMVVDRATFQSKILSNPERLAQMLELIGSRFADTLEKISKRSI